MTVLHQIESSLEKTKLYQTEESLKWPCSTKLRKVLKMTVFHQIGKHFINDCAPQHLEMPVLHQVEKSLEINVQSNRDKFKITVFH